MSVGKLRFRRHDVESELLKQARQEGNIVFGGQAIKRKLGINARRTKDFDFFSKTPKKSALIAENNLDKLFRKNVFLVRKAFNPTTYKVKHVGKDMKPRTKDDISIADFTKTKKPEPKTFLFRGVRYRILKEELAAKARLIRAEKFEFRRKKDLEDFLRIKRFGGLR